MSKSRQQLLQDYVTRSAERAPDSVSMVEDSQQITYAELEAGSNRLARLLCDTGCRRGDRICFLLPKSAAAITSILAILKADCMHVPIDTSSPAARVATILRSCEPRLLLADARSEAFVRELLANGDLEGTAIGWLDGYPHDEIPVRFTAYDLFGYSAGALAYQNSSDDAAHILFTSGSTGVPKGVLITHANVVRFIEWARRYFGISTSDRVSGHSPLHFDLSQFDMFGAFSAGAALYLVPHESNLLPNKLGEFIRRSQLTQWFSVPTILHYMAKFNVIEFEDFPSLKRVMWCGEALSTAVLIHWMKRLPHVTFTNLYGPTETTIASSYYTVPGCPDDERASIPIGTACEGEELLVLDESFRPLPAGEIGDLYIGGAGLSPGYWRDPEKTNSAFLPRPGGSDRIYRTGDLARKGEDGFIYFLGRHDSQIKSRGYRIELGEIEAALNSLDYLRESAVVAVPSGGFEGTASCCAYATNCAHVLPAAMRKDLLQKIPAYMLPSHWLQFETLPKNTNGKIDRPTLRGHFQASIAERHLHHGAA
jgi:amino acid adenylation domain-containing protein